MRWRIAKVTFLNLVLHCRVKTTTYNGLENAAVPFTEVNEFIIQLIKVSIIVSYSYICPVFLLLLQIVEHVRLERSSSYAPVFQSMFVLQERALDSTRSLDDALEMKQQRLSSGMTAKFDLTLELFDEGDAGLLGT